MLAFGYLEEEEKAFRISPKFFSLAYKGLRSGNLFLQAHDVMQDLREEVNETIMLGALHGNSITILEVLPSFEFIRFHVEPGHEVPLPRVGSRQGHVRLLLPQTQNELLDHMSFTRYTDKTIPGKQAMRAARDQILKDGYATDEGEEVKRSPASPVPFSTTADMPLPPSGCPAPGSAWGWRSFPRSGSRSCSTRWRSPSGSGSPPSSPLISTRAQE